MFHKVWLVAVVLVGCVGEKENGSHTSFGMNGPQISFRPHERA